MLSVISEPWRWR